MNLLPDGLPAEFTTADISNLGKFHEVPLNRWPTVSAKREQLMKSENKEGKNT